MESVIFDVAAGEEKQRETGHGRRELFYYLSILQEGQAGGDHM